MAINKDSIEVGFTLAEKESHVHRVHSVVVIRTSGEKAFVLAHQPNHTILVRRPVATQDGIQHVTTELLEAEVMTPIDFLVNEHNEMKAYQEKVSGPSLKQIAAAKLEQPN